MPAVKTDNDFFKADPPLLTGLSRELLFLSLGSLVVVIAVLLIIRRCRARKAAFSTISSSPRVPYSDEDAGEPGLPVMYQQRLHYQFPNRHCIIDKKMAGTYGDTSPHGDSLSTNQGSPLPSSVEFTSDNRDTCQGHDPPSGGSHSAGKQPEVTVPRFIMSRPLAPPPLTPPERSSSIFTLEEANRSRAAGDSELDASFFDQPNPDFTDSTAAASPDYLDSSTTASQTQNTSSTSSTSIPRRRSYTRMLPINTPSPTSSAMAAVQGGSGSTFAPSSFPSSSPSLPGPPPVEDEGSRETPQHIEIQGEIISVMDDSGAGWKRHTRIYGGGVCLACAAAAAANNGQGGSYGNNVRPEDRH